MLLLNSPERCCLRVNKFIASRDSDLEWKRRSHCTAVLTRWTLCGHLNDSDRHGSNAQEIRLSSGGHCNEDTGPGNSDLPTATTSSMRISTERHRPASDKAGKENWRRWGPYLSERQWSTVREDYSAWGSAWDYLPHEHARSRAYRWGEDGIAGFSDDRQYLCLPLAVWNGRVAILKANLRRSDGARIRCQLKLLRPVDGMAGGAHGQCQLPDGMSADVKFPAG
jgi:hypothetical protein